MASKIYLESEHGPFMRYESLGVTEVPYGFGYAIDGQASTEIVSNVLEYLEKRFDVLKDELDSRRLNLAKECEYRKQLEKQIKKMKG